MFLSQDYNIFMTQISPEEKKIIEELNNCFYILEEQVDENIILKDLYTQFINMLSGYIKFDRQILLFILEFIQENDTILNNNTI